MTGEPSRASTTVNCLRCDSQITVPTEDEVVIGKKLYHLTRSLGWSSISAIDDKLPELWDLTEEDRWVQFSSAAIVAVVIMMADSKDIKLARLEALLDQFSGLDEVEPVFGKAVKNFVFKWLEVNDTLDFKEHIVMWLLTNLKRGKPTTSEVQKFSATFSGYVIDQAKDIHKGRNKL